jgi:hypothetical protein
MLNMEPTDLAVSFAHNEFWTASTYATDLEACREAVLQAFVRHGPIVMRRLHLNGCWRILVGANDTGFDVFQRLRLAQVIDKWGKA